MLASIFSHYCCCPDFFEDQKSKMAKRIHSSSVNWTFITETLNPVDKAKVLPLKALSDKYWRDISTKPAELPKIDWNFYKSRIAIPGMVDSFQKSYEALKIPYPSDQGILAQNENKNADLVKSAEKKQADILNTIKNLNEELKKKESVMKYSEMTLEELYLARPDIRIDPDNPKLWPHVVEERPHLRGVSQETEK